MKKILFVFVSLLILISLSGCSIRDLFVKENNSFKFYKMSL